MSTYRNTCIADHSVTLRGPLARWRSSRWWKHHDRCEPISDDNPFPEVPSHRLVSALKQIAEQGQCDCHVCATAWRAAEEIAHLRFLAYSLAEALERWDCDLCGNDRCTSCRVREPHSVCVADCPRCGDNAADERQSQTFYAMFAWRDYLAHLEGSRRG